LVDGTEALQASAHAELGANPSAAMVKARDHAKELLAATLPRLAHLTIVVHVPDGTSLTVTDNGVNLSKVLLGVERPVDPGTHGIQVSAPGFLAATAAATLTEGQSTTLTIEMKQDPNAKAAPPPPAKEAPPPPVTPPPQKGDDGRGTRLVAGGVTLGIGGVALGVAGALAGVAYSKKGDLDAVCSTNKHCPVASQSDIDALKTFGNAATALFVIGGAAAGAGIIVLATAPPAQKTPASSGLQVTVGIAHIGVDARF
jgi:hypothetical protein